MKFALLGVDHDALELLGQLCRTREHELRVVYEAGEHLAAVRALAPRVEIDDQPEGLLARPEIDAVIVATSPDQEARVAQLRTLVQGGLRLIVLQPICDSLTAYELEMIRSDSGADMIPYSSGRGHPAIEHMSAWIRAGDSSPIGAVVQIVFERHISQRQRDTVMPQLCRDGHLIGRLIGNIEAVSATGDREDPYKNLSVGLTGSTGMTARWNVVPPGTDVEATVAIHGENGKSVLEIPEKGPWRFIVEQDEGAAQSWPDWNVAGTLVKELEGQRAGMGTWLDSCRDLEIADHAAASLRRKRTIEIRREGNPEENTFKGIMSAGGCLILMGCLLLILVFAIVEGLSMPLLTSPEEVLEMRDQEKPRWPILWRLWPVYPLLAFLALQALLLVAKAGRNENRSDSEV